MTPRPPAVPRRLYRVSGHRGFDDFGRPLRKTRWYSQRPAAERRAQLLGDIGWPATIEQLLILPEVEVFHPADWPRLLCSIVKALPKIDKRQRRNIVESMSAALADAARRAGIEAR